jgi:hypothetical protein
MKKIAAYVIAAAAMAAAAPCHALWLSSSADSEWNEGIKMDGIGRAWQISDSVEDSGFTIAFANDAKNVYMLLKPSDTEGTTRLKNIYTTDFTVWIDTGAGKGTNEGFKLVQSGGPAGGRPPAPPDSSSGNSDSSGAPPDMQQGGSSSDMPQGGPDMQQNSSSDGRDSSSRSQRGPRGGMRPGKVELIGFLKDKDHAENNIEVRVGTDTRRGVMEVRIPISLLGGVLPKKISFGLQAKAPAAEKGPGGMSGGPGGSSSGGPGGSSSGGPGGGMGGSDMGGGPGGGMGGGPGGGGADMGGGPGGGMGGGPGGGGMGGGPGGGSGGPGGQQNSGTSSELDDMDLWIHVSPAKAPSVK